MNTKFEIVSYPKGRRSVGTMWASSTAIAVAQAVVVARVAGEYVDVEVDGDRVAVVGAEGKIG